MERVVSGERRARFEGERVGTASAAALARAEELAAALRELETLGLAPLLEDGGVAGNGALALEGASFLTSASARRPGEPAVVEVLAFDAERFHVVFRGEPGREPTSDLALHACALTCGARATLHGHALSTEADARRLGLPISAEATTFGTREDLEATRAMLSAAPYPRHRTWIRRDHGFLVAAASMDEARALVRSLASR
ncbi:MAG: hypothetical protein U0234_26420 [Sandaracinus sp.]